jgi:hypothetical protein
MGEANKKTLPYHGRVRLVDIKFIERQKRKRKIFLY